MNDLDVRAFSLKHTFESAQPLTFYADYNDATQSLLFPSGQKLAMIKFSGSSRQGIISAANMSRAAVVKRFGLADNMQRIYKNIRTDSFMADAIEEYYGMRVTHNDPWETVVCFILSQVNNVKRIRRITKKIIGTYGSPILDAEGNTIANRFPTAVQLIEASKQELIECGTGFRWRYLKSAAEYCTENLDLYGLYRKSYDQLKQELVAISGIGEKIADCIALLGYGKMESFPIDVWVKRTLETVYFRGRKQKIDKLHRFAAARWGSYAGYAQQYLYWHGRQMRLLNG